MFSDEFKKEYLHAIGVDLRDKECIREAYRTAHRIREFEIDLYWKRTAYIWAMQAALIGIVLFLRTGGDTTVQLNISELSVNVSTSPTVPLLSSILLTSTLAFGVAWLWYLLIQGAKFWQDNWERHVDLLGEHLGENLYQVYPVREWKGGAPYSVTKVNRCIVAAFFMFWLTMIFWSLWELCDAHSGASKIEFFVSFLGWVVAYLSLVFIPAYMFSCSVFFDGLRMKGLGKRIVGEGGEGQALFYRAGNS